jgi:effector-binding domain-containing protein
MPRGHHSERTNRFDKQGLPKTYVVEAKQLSAQPIAVVRRRAAPAKYPTIVPHACGDVWTFIRLHCIAGTGRNVAVYLDQDGNIECGVEVPASFVGDGTVFLSTTPSGFVAQTQHMGPYQRLGEAHLAIRHWCAAHNHRLSGPNWEIYGHWHDDPHQLKTDVFYLIAS